MDCIKVKELLSVYLDNQLDSQEMKLITEHLSKCQACAIEYDKLKKTVSFLSFLKEIEPPSNFLERLHNRLEHESAFQEFLRRIFLPWKIKLPLEGLAIALVALLVLRLAYIQRASEIVSEPGKSMLSSKELGAPPIANKPTTETSEPLPQKDLKISQKPYSSKEGYVAKQDREEKGLRLESRGKEEQKEIAMKAGELKEEVSSKPFTIGGQLDERITSMDKVNMPEEKTKKRASAIAINGIDLQLTLKVGNLSQGIIAVNNLISSMKIEAKEIAVPSVIPEVKRYCLSISAQNYLQFVNGLKEIGELEKKEELKNLKKPVFTIQLDAVESQQ